MFATRSAIMLLVGCIFGSPFGHGSQSTEPGAAHAGAHMVCHTGACVEQQLLSRATGHTSLARFTPWKARLKSVLGETNEKFVDESDLGPVLVPSRLIGSTPTPSISSHLPIILPLRC